MSGQQLPEGATTVPSEVGDSADRGDNALTSGHIKGPPSGLTCPACGGAVWERNEQGLLMYRCHVGHVYTADSMAAEHESLLESTLWEALRMFQESAALHRRMERKAIDTHQLDMARRYGERAKEHEARTETIRRVLVGDPPTAA